MIPPPSRCIPLEAPGPLFQKINNAHKDDIHAISKVTANSFISGSKDSSIKHFSLDGRMIKLLSIHPACTGPYHPYLFWVTALDNFSDGSWVSGQRNSFLQCKDLRGNSYFSALANNGISGACKPRNENRICSLKCLDLYTSLVGLPGGFFEFDYDTKKTIRAVSLGTSDWVYGFCAINPDRLAVIHSTSLSIFQPLEKSYVKIDTVISYDQAERREQKPFISSIQPMKELEAFESVQKVVLSFFGGETQVWDLEAQRPTHRGLEHAKRVWQSIPHTPNSYLSSSDDGTIKLWDLRHSEESIHTFTDHPGRVSSLCLLNDHTFVAGTCASDLNSDPDRAQLYFYDLRRM